MVAKKITLEYAEVIVKLGDNSKDVEKVVNSYLKEMGGSSEELLTEVEKLVNEDKIAQFEKEALTFQNEKINKCKEKSTVYVTSHQVERYNLKGVSFGRLASDYTGHTDGTVKRVVKNKTVKISGKTFTVASIDDNSYQLESLIK
jgi:hypothetical protein